MLINLPIILVIVTLSFIGYGIYMNKRLNLNKFNYSLSIGFTVFFTILQLLYYPIQYLNLSFNLIIISSIIVIGVGIILAFRYINELKHLIFRKNTILLIISLIVFVLVYYQTNIDIAFSDSQMYINYVSQNIRIENLNMFNLYTGETGSEWEIIYLYQGYYHFGSFISWFINIPSSIFGYGSSVANITVVTWGLGLLYSLISNSFFISFLGDLDVKNKWVKRILIIFTLFYSNYYYWRIALSFYGNTFRTLLITMLMYFIYTWIKENKDEYKFIIVCILFTGLSCSSSFLFISFGVMMALAIYLFINKKEDTFITMSYLVIPILVYGITIFTKDEVHIGISLLILSIIYYIGIRFNEFKKIIYVIEEFIFKHAKLIFYIIVPIILALWSLYVNIFNQEFLYGYDFWFKDHRSVDMVLDYRFIYSNPMTFVLNIFRWLGIILIIREKGNGYLKVTFITMLLLFLNPLVSTAIADTIASNVFYRLVEVLFNPFTEAIIFLYIINKYNNKIVIVVTCSIMLLCTGLNHILSLSGNEYGHYYFYVAGAKDMLPLYKIDWEDYDIIQHYLEETKDTQDKQLVALSHTDALRSFAPQTQQIFTARDHWYPYSRIDGNFYNIAMDRHSWIKDLPSPTYTNACMYIERYKVDHIILNKINNVDYDKGSDECSYTIYENELFKLKGVIDDPNVIEYER